VKAFEKSIAIPKKIEGETMMLDKGMTPSAAEAFLEMAGEYVTAVKLGWGTARLIDREIIEQKVEIYKDAGLDVFPGGTLAEIAIAQGTYEDFLQELDELGFNAIEISDGMIPMAIEDKCEYISMAKEMGFKVYAEEGKKRDDEYSLLSPTDIVGRMVRCIMDGGADYVIVEARESGTHGPMGAEKKERVKILSEIVKGVGIRRVMFEAPEKEQQFELIVKFGSHVNIANVPPEEVIPLATLRAGLRAETMGRAPVSPPGGEE